uniref:C-type lectin domain-containing protein n=1 Tax=Panagrellus redivivus TaxID=6233 RepID=A0A7E4VT03_PANRE
MSYPGSRLASFHCIEEHFFIQKYPAKTIIGLRIPFRLLKDKFDVKNFEWTDGTPVDFVGWNRFSNPETSDGQYAPLFPTTKFKMYTTITNQTTPFSTVFKNSMIPKAAGATAISYPKTCCAK